PLPVGGSLQPVTTTAPPPSKPAVDALKRLDERLAASRLRRDALDSQSRSDQAQIRDLERQISAVHSSATEIERRVDETKSKQDRVRARVRVLEADEHRLREGIPAGNEADSLVSPVLERLRSEMNRIHGEIALGGL